MKFLQAALAVTMTCAVACVVGSDQRPLPAALPGLQLEHAHRWWIFIGHSSQIPSVDWKSAAQSVDLVIVNDDPRIGPVHQSPTTIALAYLSVGEADTGRPYWPRVEGRPFVVERNPNWPSSVRVDIRDRFWREILLDEEVPRLMALGYRGFMLDTLDTPLYLESREPARFAGSRRALVEFLRTMRARFPRATLLANGTEALIDAAPYVDGYVTEGVFATYDLVTRGYRETTRDERAWRLGRLQAALDRVRRPVFGIEYASSAGLDVGLGDWAARESRRRGFRPYVTTRDIDQIPTRRN